MFKKTFGEAKEMCFDAIEFINYEGNEYCIEGISRGLKNIKKYLANIED